MGSVHRPQRTRAIDCKMVEGGSRVVGSCDEENQPSLSFFLDYVFFRRYNKFESQRRLKCLILI